MGKQLGSSQGTQPGSSQGTQPGSSQGTWPQPKPMHRVAEWDTGHIPPCKKTPAIRRSAQPPLPHLCLLGPQGKREADLDFLA